MLRQVFEVVRASSLATEEKRKRAGQSSNVLDFEQLESFQSCAGVGRPLQRRTNIRELTERQSELLFQQAEELPGALALGLNLLYGNLWSQGQTGFVAGGFSMMRNFSM